MLLINQTHIKITKFLVLDSMKSNKNKQMNALPNTRTDCTNPILFIAFNSSFNILNDSLERCPHVNFLPQLLKEETVYYAEIIRHRPMNKLISENVMCKVRNFN